MRWRVLWWVARPPGSPAAREDIRTRTPGSLLDELELVDAERCHEPGLVQDEEPAQRPSFAFPCGDSRLQAHMPCHDAGRTDGPWFRAGLGRASMHVLLLTRCTTEACRSRPR